jgi:GDPmannose 4,6-dehydratase
LPEVVLMSGQSQRALIFGVSGQDGAWLAKLLLAQGYEVHGSSRDRDASSFENLIRVGVRDRVQLHSATPTDFRSVAALLESVRPSEVYNLAAQSSVSLSFEQPLETISSIVIGTVNIMEAIRLLNLDTRFYNASSSECFGEVPGQADEETPFRPKSPYGASKAAAYWAVANYRESYNMFACSGILFNHESHLRPARYVSQKIIRGAADIAEGRATRLRMGRLDIVRDWGWAPEYVDAMSRMLRRDQPEDFVIATGEGHSLEDFVDKVFAGFNLNWRDWVDVDAGLFRPSEIARSVGDPSKAKRLLGWEASHHLDQLVDDLVNRERQRRRGE